jgi:hypothetical protein
MNKTRGGQILLLILSVLIVLSMTCGTLLSVLEGLRPTPRPTLAVSTATVAIATKTPTPHATAAPAPVPKPTP